jgi:hypothetical protein
MLSVARDLEVEIEAARPRLSAIAEDVAATAPGEGRWSRKEILGHLVDSAANNHQRFVRAQLADALVFPAYEQDAWVSRQGYAERRWPELIALWEALNRHLTHVIARIDPAALERPCTIGGQAPVTLRFVAEDYVRHLRHHLGQILG